jgi:rubredoxin
VEKVITSRADQGTSGWIDPHNKGAYELKSNSDSTLLLHRTTANGQYTDHIQIQLTDAGGGTCVVNACSASQVTSIYDFSTNYCNIHDLYCSDVGCNALTGNPVLSCEETEVDASSGQKSKSDCYKNSEVNSVKDDTWVCSVCAHVYDAAKDGNGTAFEDLPDTFVCPVCGSPKTAFKKQTDGTWVHEHTDETHGALRQP